MTINQTQINELKNMLDLKTEEYSQLCAELEQLKSKNINPNSDEYALLLRKFQNNLKEISEIKNKLEILKK